MPNIEVIVSPAGESRVTTSGFVGESCRQADQFLREALGTATQEQLTAEFHQQTTIINQTEDQQQ